MLYENSKLSSANTLKFPNSKSRISTNQFDVPIGFIDSKLTHEPIQRDYLYLQLDIHEPHSKRFSIEMRDKEIETLVKLGIRILGI